MPWRLYTWEETPNCGIPRNICISNVCVLCHIATRISCLASLRLFGVLHLFSLAFSLKRKVKWNAMNATFFGTPSSCKWSGWKPMRQIRRDLPECPFQSSIRGTTLLRRENLEDNGTSIAIFCFGKTRVKDFWNEVCSPRDEQTMLW